MWCFSWIHANSSYWHVSLFDPILMTVSILTSIPMIQKWIIGIDVMFRILYIFKSRFSLATKQTLAKTWTWNTIPMTQKWVIGMVFRTLFWPFLDPFLTRFWIIKARQKSVISTHFWTLFTTFLHFFSTKITDFWPLLTVLTGFGKMFKNNQIWTKWY